MVSSSTWGFKPEFLNRLDEKIVFHMLERDDLIKIVDLEIAVVLKRLAAKKITLELAESAKEFLVKEGYDPNYGARPMRRAVEKHLEDPLAEHLLRGNVKEGDTIDVSHNEEEDEKALKFTARDSGDTPEEAAEPAESKS